MTNVIAERQVGIPLPLFATDATATRARCTKLAAISHDGIAEPSDHSTPPAQH